MRQFLENIKLKLKNLLALIGRVLLACLVQIKRVVFAFLLNPVVVGLLALGGGFFIGARLHEVGILDGVFGKTLSGATVYISGDCKVGGFSRVPALAEDQIIVTGSDQDGNLLGIIRKTRELVVCDKNKIALTKISPLKKLGEALVTVPELQAPVAQTKEPEWKKLAQKTLIMSGNCVSLEGKVLPPFTDEKVDVTNVELAKDNPNVFIISGIKKADKYAIACQSNSVKYSVYEERSAEAIALAKAEEEAAKGKVVKSYVGKTLLVTGACLPDSRLPKHKVTQKVAFYPMLNNPIQIVEEKLDTNGKLVWLAGFSIKHGVQVVCNSEVNAITYKEYESDDIKLDAVKPNQQGVEQDDKEAKPTTPAGEAQ